MNGHEVTLTLTKAEALVLFEWLARVDEAALEFAHPAEQTVLWELEGQLEKTLVEPFSPEYDKLLAEARKQVGDEPAASLPTKR
jgi:hypothetical protein